jgi:hypothetical protein
MMEGVCPQGACDMRRLSIRYQGQTVYTSSYSTTAYTTAYTILYTTSIILYLCGAVCVFDL